MKIKNLSILMTLVVSSALAQTQPSLSDLRHFVTCGTYKIMISGLRYAPRTDTRSQKMTGSWGHVYLYNDKQFMMELFPTSNSHRFATRDLQYAFIATGEMDYREILLLPGSQSEQCKYSSFYGWRTAPWP